MSRPSAVLRRLYHDGTASARLEIAFRVDGDATTKAAVQWRHFERQITAIASTEVRTGKGTSVHEGPLFHAGPRVAKEYLAHSTPKNVVAEGWWMRAGRPLAVVEYLAGSIRLPWIAKPVPLTGSPGLAVSYLRTALVGSGFPNGTTCGTWMVGYESGLDRDAIRRLRLHLTRLHSEAETIQTVTDAVRADQLSVAGGSQETENLYEYLKNAKRLLLRQRRFGNNQSALLAAVVAAEETAIPGYYSSLGKALDLCLRRVQKSIEDWKRQQERAMTGNVTINIGNGAQVYGDVIAARSIENSFNQIQGAKAPLELKEALKSVVSESVKVSSTLEPTKAQAIARDVKSLADEALSPAPRKEWYELSGKGLVDAAKAIGESATPLITAVRAVIGLLG